MGLLRGYVFFSNGTVLGSLTSLVQEKLFPNYNAKRRAGKLPETSHFKNTLISEFFTVLLTFSFRP